MSSETASREEAIGKFCGVTGADEERARGLLEACDWNLELAINMHVDTDDGRGKPSTSSTNTSAGPSTSTSNNANATLREVITVPDVDEDGNGPTIVGETITRPFPRPIVRRGPTRPRLDEHATDDDVRPPIRPIRQVLVQHPAEFISDMPQRRYNPRTGETGRVYDAFRDFEAETEWQEMAQQEGESSASTDSQASNANKRSLQELFRPPLDVMFRGTLSSAREVGTLQNKWLLVNIQNGLEFLCQTLNRDVWSNQTVKDILKEHFIFWQVYHDSYEGLRYVQFYNVSSFPHVSIVDPRTGEQMKSWPTTIDHNSFCDSVIEFLTEHPSPDGSSDANTMKKLRVKEEDAARTLYDQSEEAQLEAAIKASLQETEESSSSKAFVDEDSYTDAIESDTDQTQSSFQAHTSSNSSSTFGKFANEATRASNGQTSSSNANANANAAINANNTTNMGLKAEFCGTEKSSATSGPVTTNSNSNSVEKSQATTNVKEEFEDYRKYLGLDKEKFSDLVVRFPDGTRDRFTFPSDSLLKALFLLLSSRGYGIDKYNYVTTFPRRLLHELPSNGTFYDAKLSKETIFVERKQNQ